MITDYKITGELTNKWIIRTKCLVCESEMIDSIKKNGKDKDKELICDICKKETKG